MAISLDMTESKNTGRQPLLTLPSNKFTRITAAGSYIFTEGTTAVRLKNKTTGDLVWFKVMDLADATAVDATTGLLLEPGQQMDFALPVRDTAANFKIVVALGS